MLFKEAIFVAASERLLTNDDRVQVATSEWQLLGGSFFDL